MTPKMELTEEMRAALERVPDEWTTCFSWLIVYGALKTAGLIDTRLLHKQTTVREFRRTPAGRAALGEGE